VSRGSGQTSASGPGGPTPRGRLPPARRPRAAAPWPATCRRTALPPAPRPSRWWIYAPSSTLASRALPASPGRVRPNGFSRQPSAAEPETRTRPATQPWRSLFPPPSRPAAIDCAANSPLHRPLVILLSQSASASMKRWAEPRTREFGLSCYGHQMLWSLLESPGLNSDKVGSQKRHKLCFTNDFPACTESIFSHFF
jgi:hypothetical protein